MTWAVIVVRTLVGLAFFAAGLTHFLGVASSPEGLPEAATAFAGAMGRPYMGVVKLLELVGGLLVLSGRLTPLGVVVLMPVAVNIAIFDLFLVGQPGLGVVFTALLAFVAYGYRRYFAPFFVPDARIG